MEKSRKLWLQEKMKVEIQDLMKILQEIEVEGQIEVGILAEMNAEFQVEKTEMFVKV